MIEKTMFVEGTFSAWIGEYEDKAYSFSVPDEDFDLMKGISGVVKEYLETPEGKEYLKNNSHKFRTDDYDYVTYLGTYLELADKIPQSIYNWYGFSYNGEIEFDLRCTKEDNVLKHKEAKEIYQRAIPPEKSKSSPSVDDEER